MLKPGARSRSAATFVVMMSLGCSGGAEDDGSNPDPAVKDTSTSSAETGNTTDEDTSVSVTDEGVGDDTSVPPPDAPPSDTPADTTTPMGTPTEANLKVAFVGDQGTNSNTMAVLNLIKNEKADFVILLGDFDYEDDPAQWDGDLTTGLGRDYPVFGVIGNHDEPRWSVADGYKARLSRRLAAITGAKCVGDYGVKAACTYKGLFFITSGAGTEGTGHDAYIKDQLATDKSIWRVCAWHKNQHDMQVGGKTNEAGWGVYQACQNGGAIVMTGHEHSYSRTKTLTAVGDASKGHGAVGEFSKMVVKAGSPGSTFVVVSGLGGTGIRDFEAGSHNDDTWWASYYADDTVDTGSKAVHLKNGTKITTSRTGYGATFVTFNVDGDPKKARGYFKNTAGNEMDTFEVRRE